MTRLQRWLDPRATPTPECRIVRAPARNGRRNGRGGDGTELFARLCGVAAVARRCTELQHYRRCTVAEIRRQLDELAERRDEPSESEIVDGAGEFADEHVYV